MAVGRLIAHNLVETSRHAVIAGDQERLSRLIEAAMTSAQVAYVQILSSDGRLLGSQGKDEWRAYLEERSRAERLAALTLSSGKTSDLLNIPPRIAELSSDGLLLSSEETHPMRCWARLMTGDVHPFVVHLTEPIVFSTEPDDLDPVLSLTLSEQDDPGSEKTIHSPSPPVQGYIVLGMSGAQDHRTLQKIAWQVLTITCLVIALSVAAVLALTRRMTAPLQELSQFAGRIAGGDLSGSITPRSKDEIGQLAGAFNHMAAALHDRERDLRELNRTLESRVNDRTLDLQRANQELTKLSNLKTALVSNASHELRTPLTSIKVHVKNLVDGVNGVLPSEQLSPLRRVLDNADRLGQLIGELLDLSKLQTLTPSVRRDEVSACPLLSDVIDSLRYFSEQKALTISWSCPDDLPALSGDRDKLWRLFTNVLHNAIKFTPPGGRITVSARQEPRDTILFSVHDTGRGIPPGDRENIFLPFFRSQGSAQHIRGTGLGLSIAKEIVRLHGGAIWVECEMNAGSCFYIRLPSGPFRAVCSPRTEPNLMSTSVSERSDHDPAASERYPSV